MNKEFRLGPGEMEKIVMRGMNRKIKKTLVVANYSSQGKWYTIHEDDGNYIVGNVNRPDYVKDPTFEEPERHAEDPI
jgi:hypothetical protein